MELVKYNKVIDGILEGLKENEKIIVDAFKTELQEFGHNIDIKYLKNLFKDLKKIPEINSTSKKMAVYYSGNIDITVSFLLLALKNDLTITLFNERYGVFNTCIITILEEVLKDLKLKNTFFEYGDKYDEKFLIDNQNKYEKIIFIGDYFEYKNLKHYIKNDIVYDNFGFIKGYIDKENNMEEYQKIMRYCYMNNIDMDFYTDKEEFLEEVNSQDKIIIFANNEKEINELKSKLKNNDIMCNEFPYNNYKFNINEFVKKII